MLSSRYCDIRKRVRGQCRMIAVWIIWDMVVSKRGVT